MKSSVKLLIILIVPFLILNTTLGEPPEGGGVVRQPVPDPCYMMIDEEREVIVAYHTVCDGNGGGCDMTDCPEGSYAKEKND